MHVGDVASEASKDIFIYRNCSELQRTNLQDFSVRLLDRNWNMDLYNMASNIHYQSLESTRRQFLMNLYFSMGSDLTNRTNIKTGYISSCATHS